MWWLYKSIFVTNFVLGLYAACESKLTQFMNTNWSEMKYLQLLPFYYGRSAAQDFSP